MASEAVKGLGRILANYARLLTNLIVGLAVVPVLMGWLGEEAFGLIALLGASVGFAALFREMTHRSLVRELAAAWHKDPGEHFARAYATSWLLSGGIGAVTVLSFVLLLGVISLLDIPADLRGPAYLFVVAQATHAILVVVLSPAFNMYVVQERFVWYNFWITTIRAGNLTSALILAYAVGIRDVPTGLVVHGVLWAVLSNLALVSAVGMIMLRDRRLVPRPRLASREHLRAIGGTFGWNSAVQVAMTLHERVPQFIINLTPFGLLGNAVWGLSYRFIAMVRMATMGVQFGADAVTTRLSSADPDEAARAVREFVGVQTRLNAFIALPAGVVIYVLSRPMLDLWLGARVKDPETILPPAVIMTQILAAGITARALSEGWMLILYGAGHVRRYAPLVLAGGALNPIASVVLIVLVPELALFWPAVSFAVIMTGVNMLILPGVGARHLGMRYLEMVGPIWRPAVATAIAAPVLVLAETQIQRWSLLTLAGVGIAFAAIYVPVGGAIVLTGQERRRFLSALLRRLGLSRRPVPAERSPSG